MPQIQQYLLPLNGSGDSPQEPEDTRPNVRNQWPERIRQLPGITPVAARSTLLFPPELENTRPKRPGTLAEAADGKFSIGSTASAGLRLAVMESATRTVQRRQGG